MDAPHVAKSRQTGSMDRYVIALIQNIHVTVHLAKVFHVANNYNTTIGCVT